MLNLKEISLVGLLPPNLAEDPKVKSAAEALDTELQAVTEAVAQSLILSRIDELSEEVVNLLAWQFHVEGYELAETLEEKRNMVRNSIELHRYKGTKYALLKVLELLNLRGDIQEWHEYAGDPYKFKVSIDLLTRGIDEETSSILDNLIQEYKNARSWLESLDIYLTNKSAVPVFVPKVLSGEDITVYPYNITELQQNEPVYCGVGYQAVETTVIYPL